MFIDDRRSTEMFVDDEIQNSRGRKSQWETIEKLENQLREAHATINTLFNALHAADQVKLALILTAGGTNKEGLRCS